MSETFGDETPDGDPAIARRQEWLAALARADVALLEEIWADVAAPPAFEMLRPPESGLAMVRGRIGGSGAPFNAGEMTMTRCVVATRDSDGTTRLSGVGYVAGRDKRQAEIVAKLDALFQDSAGGVRLRDDALARIGAIHDARRARSAAKTAATRVEFFTMERGG